MTIKQVITMMKARYLKYLIGVLLLLVGLQGIMGIRQVNEWQSAYHFYHSKHFIKMYRQSPEDFVGYADAKGTKPADVTLQAYQQSSLKFNNTEVAPVMTIPSIGMLMFLGLFFTVGLWTFTYDRWTHFDRFLFGLGTTRMRLYWSKIMLVGLTIVTGFIVSRVLYYSIVISQIPQPYLSINWHQLFQHEFGLLILGLLLYAFGNILGLLVGELVTLLIGAYAFLATLIFISDNLQDLGRFLQATTAIEYQTIKNANSVVLTKLWTATYSGVLYNTRQQVILIVSLLISALVLVIAGSWCYRRLSLENNRKIITLPQLNWWLLGLASAYLALILCMNGFFSRIPFELIATHEKTLLLWYFIRNFLVIGLLGWLLIKRPWQHWDHKIKV